MCLNGHTLTWDEFRAMVERGDFDGGNCNCDDGDCGTVSSINLTDDEGTIMVTNYQGRSFHVPDPEEPIAFMFDIGEGPLPVQLPDGNVQLQMPGNVLATLERWDH